MNVQLVESLVQQILALPVEEQDLFKEKLLVESSELASSALMRLAQRGQAFDFLNEEPDLYTLADGEPL
jgi:hypothetical protein